VKFEQDDFRIRLVGLPKHAPNLSQPSRSSATANRAKATKASAPKNRATYPRKSVLSKSVIRVYMIDAHQHFWQLGRFDYPWMSEDLGVLYRDYLPRSRADPQHNDRRKRSWSRRATASRNHAGYLNSLNRITSSRCRRLGRSNRTPEIATHPKFKGVRHLVESEPNDDWLVQPASFRFAKTLARGLSYDLLVHTRHLKHVPVVAESCPDLQLVIDHLAKPPIARNEIDEWSRA
jgi:L-fuconolactonase